MTSFRGFLRGLFGGGKRSKFSSYDPGAPATDLNVVVKEAMRRGCDGLALTGLKPGADLRPLAAMTSLRSLELKEAGLGDDELSALEGLEQLEHLDLSGAPIDGSCLVRIGGLPKLEHLDLSGTGVVDVAVLALRRYPALATLDLSRTAVTEAALPHLRELPALKELRLRDLGLEKSAFEVFAGRSTVDVAC